MRTKKKGLKFKISLAIFILFSVMGLLLIGVSYQAFYETYIKFYNEKAQNVVRMTANMVDGDELKKYADGKETDVYYETLQKQFNIIKSNTSELSYLYLFKPEDDRFIYIMEAYTPSDNMDNIAEMGDVYQYGETEYRYLVPDMKAKKPSTDIIYGEDVGFGRSLSTWAPILDSDGNLVATVEADYVLTNLQNEINSYMVKVVLFLVLSLLLILFIMMKVMKWRVTNPLTSLTSYVDSYERGEFAIQQRVYKGDDEISWLADSFQNMVLRINEHVEHIAKVTAEKERIGAELNVATQIQADMLPCIFPAFPERKEFDIFATMTPAKEVGGDFYDFFMVDDKHLAMVMADVSGKGVPAALFMVIGKTLLKDCTQPGVPLGDVFTKVNDLLCESNKEGLFITAFEGILNLETGELEYANAGHEPPFICKKDEQYVKHQLPAGFVLAGMEGMKYKEGTMKLAPGDRIFLYTDGVTEAINVSEELFEMERLEEVLNQNKDKVPMDLLPAIKNKIDIFVGEADQFDDITMLCVEFKEMMEV